MHFSAIDAYHHLAAKGDPEAYTKLYLDFTKKARRIIKTAISSFKNYQENPGDFSEIVDIMFFKTLNEYAQERGSFSAFQDLVLTKRLAYKVQLKLINESNMYAPLDQDVDEEFEMIEAIPDPNQIPHMTEAVIKKFKHKIATPNSHRTEEERFRDRALLLLMAGYKNVEIARILNLSLGEFRVKMSKLFDDPEVINLKMELK